MDAVFRHYITEGNDPKRIVSITFRRAGTIYFPVDECLDQSATYPKIINSVVSNVGTIHRGFNITPENYGPTIGNLSVSFVITERLMELLYRENWRNLPLSLIYYGDDDVTIYTVFNGLIQTHPPLNTSGSNISVTAESIESITVQKEAPGYVISANDWPRCPERNLGKRCPIIMGSDTTEKPLICVDDGAWATLVPMPSGASYSDTSEGIVVDSLAMWDVALLKPELVIRIGQELMLVVEYLLSQNILKVERGYGGSPVGVLTIGALVLEHKQRQQYLLTCHTIPGADDQDFRVIAIDPDDGRERFVVPDGWYAVTYNGTVGGVVMTWITATQPINRGFFSTTQVNAFPLLPSSSEFIANTLEPMISFDAAEGYSTPVSIDQPIKEVNKYLSSDLGYFSVSEGWANIDALFGNTNEYASFTGQASWDNYGVKDRTLAFWFTNKWGQIGAIPLQFSDSYNYFYMLLHILIPYNLSSPDFYLYGNIDEQSSECHYRMESLYDALYSLYSQSGLHQDRIPISNANGSYGTINLTNWDNDFAHILVDVRKNEFWETCNQYMLEPPWENARGKMSKMWVNFRVCNQILYDNELMSDVDDNTYAYAQGILTSDFGSIGEYGYSNTITRRWVGGQNSWPARPAGDIQIINSYVEIKFRCDLASTSEEAFTVRLGRPGSTTLYNLKASSYNTTPGSDITVQLPVSFSADYWDETEAQIFINIGRHDDPPIRIYYMKLHVYYNVVGTKTNAQSLWTDDESGNNGYLLNDLRTDEEGSYAWLKYKTLEGDLYSNKDGVIHCPIDPTGLESGASITRVRMQIKSHINKFNETTKEGGCMHEVGSNHVKAAWAWYAHLGHRTGAYTGTTGTIAAAGTTFTDANRDFEELGVQAGDVVYIQYKSGKLDQGSFVVASVTNATTIQIDVTNTHHWDIDKAAWTGFVENRTGDIYYKIYRPHLLAQDNATTVNDFDITSELADWDAVLDFQEPVQIRGHLWTDAAAGVGTWPNSPPYYNDITARSVFLAWSPKLVVEFNNGKEAILVARGVNGVDDGNDNPVELVQWLLENEGDMSSDNIDTDSFALAATNRDSVLVDYSITEGTIGTIIRDLTYYFGWTVLWKEKAYAHIGVNPRILRGWQISDAVKDPASIQNMYALSNAATDPTHNLTEANATTGWTALGGTLSSVGGSIGSSPGSYHIKLLAAGGSALLQVTTLAAYRYKPLTLTFWARANVAAKNASVTVTLLSTMLQGGGTNIDNHVITVTAKATGGKYVIEIPAMQALMTTLRLTATFIAAEYLLIDNISILETDERISDARRLCPVNYGTMTKWGPHHTVYDISFDIKPWTQVDEVIAGTSSKNVKSIASHGSEFYADLQTKYGYLQFPVSMSRVKAISDLVTAQEFTYWLQRYVSQRIHIAGMDLGPKGRILETGDVIYVDMLHYYLRSFRYEYAVEKFFQVLSQDGKGIVDMIEVSDRMDDCLI